MGLCMFKDLEQLLAHECSLSTGFYPYCCCLYYPTVHRRGVGSIARASPLRNSGLKNLCVFLKSISKLPFLVSSH